VANGLAIAAFTVLDFGTAFAQEAAPAAVAAKASGSMFAAPSSAFTGLPSAPLIDFGSAKKAR
jgi:hypothetical protein